MPIEGKLEELALTDFLQVLSMNRKSGHLKIESLLEKEKNVAEIILKNGYLQLITIIGDDTLFELLKKSDFGKEINEELKFNEKEMLKNLMKKVKNYEPVIKILREVNENRMFEILSWKYGNFRFEEKKSEDEFLPDEISFNIQDILIESSRKLDEWVEISKRLPSYSVVPYLSEKWLHEGASSLDLSPLEWKILALIDGVKRVEDIINEFKIPSLEIVKKILKLYERGLIDFKEKDKAEEEKAKKEAEILFIKARDMIKRKKYLEAEAFLSKAISLYPDFIMAHLFLADLYYNLKNYRLASQEYYQAIRRDPYNPLGYYGMGFVRIKFGDLEGALKAWEKALEYSTGELKDKIKRLISLLKAMMLEIENRKMLV